MLSTAGDGGQSRSEDPRNPGTTLIVLENTSKVALTAVAFTGPSQRFPLNFDSAVRIGFPSAIKPGGQYKINLPVVYPAGQIQLAAAILADGENFECSGQFLRMPANGRRDDRWLQGRPQTQ